jgi:hypothetical protein
MKECTLCDVIEIFKKQGFSKEEATRMAMKYHYTVELVTYKVVKRGDKWCVVSHTDPNKSYGCHDSKEKAHAQLRAIKSKKGD